MNSFPGFSDSETSTAIPDSFFNVLLKDVQDEDELRVILYALWRVERMEGTYPGLSEAEFAAAGTGMDAGRVTAGLEKAVQRGALLRARHEAQTMYFLNSARGRPAAQAFAEGGHGDSVSTASLPLERPNVFKLYEENIGPLTPLIADALKDAEAAYAPQWIAEAIQLAVEHNKRSWKYCEAILKRWKERGVAKSRLDETIRQLASATQKTKSNDSSKVEPVHPTLGDPHCPHCGGIGYLRKDVPIGDPDFGEVFVCVCRRRQVADAVRDRLFALSHLEQLRDLTFESFKPRGRPGLRQAEADSLQAAHNQARKHAENLKGWLFLQGGAGCGKTHLAVAAANFAVGMGVPTLFLTVPDLLDTLRYSYDSEDTTFEKRFEEIRNAQLLVLDDFGTQNATGWAQEKLFQIVNYRYISKLPTIVTSNLALDEIEERIRSRLADPELVTQVRILAPDFRRPLNDLRHPELSSLELHSGRTFEAFSMRKAERLNADAAKSLKDAYDAAQSYAGKPRGWLVFTGDYGTGKTHLAAAIANRRAELGNPPLFVVVPDLLDHLRATFSPTSQTTFDRRFEEIRAAPLLVLDDLGTQSMTPWVREKLYQLFNYRSNAMLPTVVTIASDALETLDDRLHSRLLDGQVCRVVALTDIPPYRGEAGPHKGSSRRVN